MRSGVKELRLEWTLLEVQGYPESRPQPGMSEVGGIEVILDHDDAMNAVLSTGASYLDLYAPMFKEDTEQNQQAVRGKLAERRLMDMQRGRKLGPFIVDSYNERIGRLSKEIAAATSAPDFMGWWQQVQDEIGLLKQKQATVRQAVEQGNHIQKADALRGLIERITCHWATVPTTDKRYEDGTKAVCRAVTVKSKETAKDQQGRPIETMTVGTPPGWSSGRPPWTAGRRGSPSPRVTRCSRTRPGRGSSGKRRRDRDAAANGRFHTLHR